MQEENEIYELWYSIRNAGDGSAVCAFFNSKDSAEKDQIEHNKASHAWGEDCFSCQQLVIKEGKIFLLQYHWLSQVKRHEERILELPKAPETMKLLKSRFDDLIDIENKYKILQREIKTVHSAHKGG